jgi:hypothetical protein
MSEVRKLAAILVADIVGYSRATWLARRKFHLQIEPLCM